MKFEIRALELPDVKLIIPQRFKDDRGWLSENYDDQFFVDHLGRVDFLREVTSYSHSGVLRGMHYEVPGNVKLVRAVQGCVFDVVVDVRHDSKSFGCWASVELGAENGFSLYIPPGFAHGYYSLESSVVQYKLSELYSPDCARTILWNDADIAISWPNASPILSDADRNGVTLAEYTLSPEY